MNRYKRLRKKQLHLINNEIEDLQKQLFIDYLNLNPYLYDDINIDADTIYLINSEFLLYYVYTKDFNFYFIQELKKHYPIYLNLLKLESRDELLNISTNIKFREFAEEVIDNRFTKSKSKTTADTIGNTKSNSTSNSGEKEASKTTPQTITSKGDFEDIFNWEDASAITQNKNNSTLEDTTDNTENTKQKNLSKLYNLAKNFDTYNIKDKELNQQAIISIENIINYYFKKNKSFDYLIEKLKPCFVNVY